MEKAKKILFKAHDIKKIDGHWGQSTISDDEFEYAINKGVMFHNRPTTRHSECISKIRELLKVINDCDVANAFLYSLSTRCLEYRSALGSYWYVKNMPDHESTGERKCFICHWDTYNDLRCNYEFRNYYNTLNYERYRYGGVRHTKIQYALLDLEEFIKLPSVEHTKEDVQILLQILDCVSELKPNNKAGSLQKIITSKKIFNSNKNEVSVILDILGICGVLENKEHHCYSEGFFDCIDRNPPEETNDYEYPINWWQVKDGINSDRLKIVFPML